MVARNSRRAGLMLGFVLSLGSLGSACSDAADDIDQYSDCIDICGRFQDCVDEDYDTDGCADRCEDMDHRNGASDVDQCEDCLDDMSCTESAFNCATECVGIVP